MTTNDDGALQVLVMDANLRNAEVLGDFLTAEGYTPVLVTDLDRAEDALANADEYVFAIVDIDRFDTPVWSHCERLREHSVPFIVLSGIRDRSLRRESHERGADAFVDKPIPKRELRALLQSAVRSGT